MEKDTQIIAQSSLDYGMNKKKKKKTLIFGICPYCS